jgi:hypothetical protein
MSFFTFIETVKTEAVLTIVTPRNECTTALFYVTKQYTYELIDAWLTVLKSVFRLRNTISPTRRFRLFGV